MHSPAFFAAFGNPTPPTPPHPTPGQLEFEGVRKEMEKEAKRAAKLEQRVGIVAGGLAARQDKLRGEAEEAWQALRAAATELECFRWGPGGACAQCRASAAVPRSVWQELACMKSPVLLGMLKRIARQRVERWWRWAPHADCCISPGTQLTRRSRDGYAGASGATPGRPSPAVHLPDEPAALPPPRRALHGNEQRAAPERIEELQALVAAQAAREKDLQVRPFPFQGASPPGLLLATCWLPSRDGWQDGCLLASLDVGSCWCRTWLGSMPLRATPASCLLPGIITIDAPRSAVLVAPYRSGTRSWSTSGTTCAALCRRCQQHIEPPNSGAAQPQQANLRDCTAQASSSDLERPCSQFLHALLLLLMCPTLTCADTRLAARCHACSACKIDTCCCCLHRPRVKSDCPSCVQPVPGAGQTGSD